MFRKMMMFSLLVCSLYAVDLRLSEGFVKAHTEVFGDKSIDPKSDIVSAKLTMDEGIESLSGEVSLELMSLQSDNKKRDANMYETLNVKENNMASFDIKEVKKVDENYTISGILHLNNIDKSIETTAVIDEKDKTLMLNGAFSIKMSDFGIEPPKLLFLSVRDRVDIAYGLNLLIEK